MTVLIMVLHAIVCLLLIIVILMQSGKGGGLTETFSGAENIFGAQTNVFMVKTTTIIATFFLVTCLGLTFLSIKRNESLMSKKVASKNMDAAATMQKSDSLVEDASQAITDTVNEVAKETTNVMNEAAETVNAVVDSQSVQ